MEKKRVIEERKEPKEPRVPSQWLVEVIKSCENNDQMELCEKLKKNFYTMFKVNHNDEIENMFHLMSQKLNYYQHKEVSKKEKLK